MAIEGAEPYPCGVTGADPEIIDPAPFLTAVVADFRNRIPPPVIAARFHATVAEMILAVARTMNAPAIGLTGGVFQNLSLLHLVSDGLWADGRTILTHRQVPCNDGGLSLGQAAIAGGI